MLLEEQNLFNIKNPIIETKDYLVKIADRKDDVEQAYRLRFEVFNLELGEGLDNSYEKGLDIDDFDNQFLHLVLIYKKTSKVIATYRIQNYELAKLGKGFYSATRFNFDDLPMDMQKNGIETSRACVGRLYRNSSVFFLLWKGLAIIMKQTNMRYFFGCSSVMSTNPQDANGLVKFFQATDAYHHKINLNPMPGFECPYNDKEVDISKVQLPILFSIYLRFSCQVCSVPCFDRSFKTITFLIIFDINYMPQRTMEYFTRQG